MPLNSKNKSSESIVFIPTTNDKAKDQIIRSFLSRRETKEQIQLPLMTKRFRRVRLREYRWQQA